MFVSLSPTVSDRFVNGPCSQINLCFPCIFHANIRFSLCLQSPRTAQYLTKTIFIIAVYEVMLVKLVRNEQVSWTFVNFGRKKCDVKTQIHKNKEKRKSKKALSIALSLDRVAYLKGKMKNSQDMLILLHFFYFIFVFIFLFNSLSGKQSRHIDITC